MMALQFAACANRCGKIAPRRDRPDSAPWAWSVSLFLPNPKTTRLLSSSVMIAAWRIAVWNGATSNCTFVLALAFDTILSDPSAALRTLAAHAALAESLAIGLLARGERRSRLQLTTLSVAVIGSVAFGWACH